MRLAVLLLHDVEGSQFGQDDIQQSTALQVDKAFAGLGREDDFVQFVLDTLAADDLDPVGHPLQRLERLVLDLEVQLGGKPYAAHHPQGIIRERDAGFQWSGDDAVLQIRQTVKGVDQFTEPVLVQTDSHRIDGEVATVLVILQRTVLNDGLTRVVTITLLTGTHELHLVLHTFLKEFHLRRSEVAEHAQMGFLAHYPLQFLSHRDTTAHHHHVDIVGGALQEDVTHIAAHHIAGHTQLVGGLADLMENLLVQYL